MPVDRKSQNDPESLLEVTVVIPAFNEENAIAAELQHLNAVLTEAKLRYEIIVVDDGSEDDTAKRAEAEGCRLIRQPRNRGYGAALKRGFREAQSELVVITDADGTYPAEEIPSLLRAAADYDMVVGSRTGPNVHIPLERRPAKWFLRVLASYLAGFRIPDLNSGLRVIRREHVRRFAHILPNGFSFTTTITLALLCNDMAVGYETIDYKKRIGKSKIRPSHAYRFLLLILRVIMLFNPLKIFLPLGALVGAVGVGKLVYDIGKSNLSESAVMCLIASLLIWCVGLLADQTSRLGMDRESWD